MTIFIYPGARENPITPRKKTGVKSRERKKTGAKTRVPQFFYLTLWMSIFLALNLVKVKVIGVSKKTNTLYILELMKYLFWRVGEMMECVYVYL
jgi:hypothetical protein